MVTLIYTTFQCIYNKMEGSRVHTSSPNEEELFPFAPIIRACQEVVQVVDDVLSFQKQVGHKRVDFSHQY